jgi:hypothetical protein
MLPDSIATGQNVWRAALRSDNAYQSWKAFTTSPAVADTDSMRTIANIGVNESSNYYFSVFEGVNTKCQYGVIFFSDKASLSVLLAAKMASRRIKLLT